MNYYIADTHFGHQKVISFDQRPFNSVEEMDQTMIARWNEVVRQEDDVYILGDFCLHASYPPAWYLEQLSGRKHLIQGNHDGILLKDSKAVALLESIDKMLFVRDGDTNLVLCHFPLAEWNGFYRGAYHIYGHVHQRDSSSLRYMMQQEKALNAGCMLNQYCPVSFEKLVKNNQTFQSYRAN